MGCTAARQLRREFGSPYRVMPQIQGRTMTLSEVVRASVADCCDTDLSREMCFGKANQVDFSGRSALIGNIRVELERRREDPVNNVVKA
jgi:hypothetical protein